MLINLDLNLDQSMIDSESSETQIASSQSDIQIKKVVSFANEGLPTFEILIEKDPGKV